MVVVLTSWLLWLRGCCCSGFVAILTSWLSWLRGCSGFVVVLASWLSWLRGCSGLVVVLTSWLFWLRGCSDFVVVLASCSQRIPWLLEVMWTSSMCSHHLFFLLFHFRLFTCCVPSMFNFCSNLFIFRMHLAGCVAGTPHLKLTLCKVVWGLRFIMFSIIFWGCIYIGQESVL